MNQATASASGKLDDMIAQADTGARHAPGSIGKLLTGVAIAWSCFQLWLASPLPFVLGVGVFNNTEARSIHLAFAMFLAFTCYPAFRTSPRDRVPLLDWLFAFAGAFAAAYLLIFYEQLSDRPGAPITRDLVVASVGIVLLLEATRRALGPPLMIVALVFLTYSFAGPYMPEVISHQGASLSKVASHQWLGTEGVFGIALGVSTSFVFLFVLFGSLLEKAGAGNWFIKVAFSLLGHMKGGPAKAAILASGMTGLISGSSIANTVTTGTFTIPLMKRMGLSAEKAGAVEVAASSDGQIMPPIMGAAAFLMVEYVGIPYNEVIKHAFLPAVVSYLSFLYIIHLEAVKLGLEGLPRRIAPPPWKIRLLRMGINLASVIILAAAVYYGIGWVKIVAGDSAAWILAATALLVYLALLWVSARVPELELDDPNSPVVELPEARPTALAGLHFLLPVVVLIWCLMVEHLSPGLSAFYATALMIFILVTQRPLLAVFRGVGQFGTELKRGFWELKDGLESGARNMIGIGVATAAAGIVVGTVTLTGLGPVMTEFVEWLSGGSLIFMLILIAIISLILGMGLPTTANYIVVSTLMAPVVVTLGAQHGLVVPLIAVHLFVFYFGIMADVTPPVGLASFAASAISGADPIRTGIQAFVYAIRTGVLPFMFIFNTDLILYGVTNPLYGLWVFLMTLLAMCLFAAGIQGYFVTRNRIYESVVLILIAFTLVRPGFWMDRVVAPFESVSGAEIESVVADLPPESDLRLRVEYINFDDKLVRKVVLLPLGAEPDPGDRLRATGLETVVDGDRVMVDNVEFNSPAERAGLDFDQTILGVDVPAAQPSRYWMYLPAFAMIGVIVSLQRSRRRRQPVAQPA